MVGRRPRWRWRPIRTSRLWSRPGAVCRTHVRASEAERGKGDSLVGGVVHREADLAQEGEGPFVRRVHVGLEAPAPLLPRADDEVLQEEPAQAQLPVGGQDLEGEGQVLRHVPLRAAPRRGDDLLPLVDHLGDQDDRSVVVGKARLDEVAPSRGVVRRARRRRPMANVLRHLVQRGRGVAPRGPRRLAVEALHHLLVLWEDRPHRDAAAGLQVMLEDVLVRVRADRGARQLLQARVVQQHAGVKREDALGRGDEGVDVALGDLGMVHHQDAETDHHVDQSLNVNALHATDALERGEDLGLLEHLLRQVRVQRGQAQGGILEDLDEGAAHAEEDHGAELRIDGGA
mmetsp:Transcript_91030/g.253444  ORF Transcript_91030/g.253444 Transcript_91030/m.253444 type:complete len:344 (-) Transcript_91030:179-1210(-)